MVSITGALEGGSKKLDLATFFCDLADFFPDMNDLADFFLEINDLAEFFKEIIDLVTLFHKKQKKQ